MSENEICLLIFSQQVDFFYEEKCNFKKGAVSTILQAVVDLYISGIFRLLNVLLVELQKQFKVESAF